MSSSREQDFLQSLASRFSFTGKRFNIFIARFKKEHQGRLNRDLALEILTQDQNRDQVFQDHLSEILDSLKEDGCGLPPPKRGRASKGNEPWLIAYRWIWEVKFPEWEAQNPKSSLVSSVSLEQWQSLCKKVLKEKRQPNINELLRSEGVEFKVDDLFIPLGLVEKKQTKIKPGDISFSMQGSVFYEPQPEEIVRRFDKADEFFETVIQGERWAKSRIIIIGEPGAGKTTLLQKIADQLPDGVLPVWVSLADLQGLTLDEYLFKGAWWSQADKTLSLEVGEEFRQWFVNGRVCLLLDGVDEMTVPENQKGRSQLRVIYEQVKGWGDRVRVIMTCRVNVWEVDPLFNEFEMYRNLPLEYPEQVEQYIDNFFSNPKLSVRSGEELKAELRGNDRVQDTVKNPLRLALLCHAWLSCGGKLPDTQAGLYKMFLESFYQIKEKEFYVEPDQQNLLNQALGQLALEALDREQSRYRIDRATAEKVLGHPEQPGSYFYQALKLGLLNKIGYLSEDPSQECYAFIHPTFQDYYASFCIGDGDLLFEQINRQCPSYKRIFNRDWHDAFSFWLNNESIENTVKNKIASKILNLNDYCGEHYISYSKLIIASNINLFTKDLQEIILDLLFQWSFRTLNFSKHLTPQGIELSLQFSAIANNFLKISAKNILKEVNTDIITPFLYEKLLKYENIWSLFFQDDLDFMVKNTNINIYRKVDEYAKIMRILILHFIGKHNKSEVDNCLVKLMKEMQIVLQNYQNDNSPHMALLIMTIAGKIIDLSFDFYKNYVSHHLINLVNILSDFRDFQAIFYPQSLSELELLRKVLVEIEYDCFNFIDNYFYKILSASYNDRKRFQYLVSLQLQNFLASDAFNSGDDFITINRMNKDSYLPSPEFLISCQDKDKLLGSLSVIFIVYKEENELLLLSLIKPLVYLSLEFKDKYIQLLSAYILRIILVNIETLKEAVRVLKKYRDKHDCNFSNLDVSIIESLLGYCSYHMSYQDFYEAWHSSEESETRQLGSTPQTQQLDRQFFNLQDKLKPTDTTYPLCLDLSSLKTLKDPAAICQKLATLSYKAIDPNFEALDIPENIQDPTQLETILIKFCKHLKTQNPNLKTLALILHKSDPTPELLAIFDVLSSSFSIAWITDQPHPYRSFLPTAENLPELIQTWLMELD